ncbi:MAG: hypothetical protein MUC88_07710 [Planctomycetes bacterium]|jgi:hypothetical protein|nr:hypothetical protein [Planctomycetota bacterium]
MAWRLVTIVSVLLGTANARGAEDAALARGAAAALRKATAYFRDNVATEGGYLWRYSADLKTREGEGVADDKTVWLQPPGTPAVGQAFLQAYWDTGDRYYLEAALATGHCLVRGQLRCGGWDNSITFDPAKRPGHAYRVDAPVAGRSQRNTATLDDDKTQSALRFLMHLDATLGFKNETIHEAARYALEALLKVQYPNGAWPQQFSQPPDPKACPVVPASYPDTWPREYPGTKYAGFYTFNDNAMGDVVDVMALAAAVYRDQRYLHAVERVGDFILLAQMPEPQPAWAQQYDLQMHPAWARKFEPAAVTGGESQGVIEMLLRIYRETGRRRYLDAVPKALQYLRRSVLSDGRLARFYELKTNRPLYFTKDYVMTYSDADTPTHYVFKVGNRLDSLQRAYEQALALPAAELGPKPYQRPAASGRSARPSAARVLEVIDSLDEQGRWVEPGRLRYHGPEDPTRRIIDCRTFISNCRTLSSYLAGVGGRAALPDGDCRWTCGAPLVAARAVDGVEFISMKDPSIVRDGDNWHLFCTVRGPQRSHAIVHASFREFGAADRAPRHILSCHSGFFCAPQVFYFTPQKKWYLVCQAADEAWGQPPYRPAFSTTTAIGDPNSWTKLAPMFDAKPDNITGWLDFWVICDDAKAHLFFTSLDGKMWRAETTLAAFPKGWSTPVVALEGDIFEASHTYRLQGLNQYLTVVEAQNGHGWRYFKAYLADRLDGPWQPLAAEKDKAFASIRNVQPTGAKWTDVVSHGELLRAGRDEKLEVDPADLCFLFQGVSDRDRAGKGYGAIPWKLGLLEPVR